MKIKVADLKSFKANAAFIKQNSIIPVLSYLKFQDGAITKNNLSAFLIQKIGKSKEAFLVDEKILMSFIDNTSDEEIEIKLDNKRVMISDSTTKDYSPTEEIINFPSNEDSPEDQTEFDLDVLSAIKITSAFIMPDGDMPAKSHIFIGKKAVAGSNGFVAYIETFKKELPEVVLKKDTAAAVSKFDTVNFSQTERYHFFENGNCKYGFIKPDYPFFDLTVFGTFNKKSPKFTINKNDFIRFNDICISSSVIKTMTANFTIAGVQLKLTMKDADYERDIVKDVVIEGKMEGEFMFMPIYMNQLLKNVPDTDLTFYQEKDKYYVTGDSGFTSLIMATVHNTIK